MPLRSERILNWLKYYAAGLYHSAGRDNALLLAEGMAFSTFVCMIPFALIIFSILGLLLEKLLLENLVYSVLGKMIPYQAYASYLNDLIHSRIAEFKLYNNWAGIAGLAGLLFAASGLFSTMRTILNTIFHLGRSESPFWGKLRDFGMVALVLVFFLLSTTLLPALDILKEYALRSGLLSFLRMGFLGGLVTGVIAFTIIFAAFFLIYFLVPKVKLSGKVVLVSSLSAAILWEMAKQLFGYYITGITVISEIYGVYALIVIIAFWIYYTSIVFIVGAEIGQLYRERNSKDVKFSQ